MAMGERDFYDIDRLTSPIRRFIAGDFKDPVLTSGKGNGHRRNDTMILRNSFKNVSLYNKLRFLNTKKILFL